MDVTASFEPNKLRTRAGDHNIIKEKEESLKLFHPQTEFHKDKQPKGAGDPGKKEKKKEKVPTKPLNGPSHQHLSLSKCSGN